MSGMTFPKTLIEHTDYQPMIDLQGARHYGDEFTIPEDRLDDPMVQALRDAADKAGDKPLGRVLEAIQAARAGDTKKMIPSLRAAPEMLLAYFRTNLQDGWVYSRGVDGHLHAHLVTGVRFVDARSNDDKPYISIDLATNSQQGNGKKAGAMTTRGETFYGAQVARKKVSDLLEDANLYIETPALRAEYDKGLEHYTEVLRSGFSHQYLYTGVPLGTSDYRSDRTPRDTRKVIHDLHRSEVATPARFVKSSVFSPIGGEKVTANRKAKMVVTEDGEADHGMGQVPITFDLRVFDLAVHEFLWVNAIDLERYVYDKTLSEKIVLPEDQRNLLDILTSDLDDFTGDVITGKSAGNVVLAKGPAGVGKTLTAEVYSELIERPLYSIHSGSLGVRADEVRKNLEVSFKRAKRWSAVLLLDEADVFVLERGDNLEQNAIVAEFLRTLEYFDGLMFMTTNRADSIDDAILSRAAAIIDYGFPTVEAIRAIWKVQAANMRYTFPEDLLEEVVHGFKTISGRDVKMLLRLALRMAKGHDKPLDAEIIQRCAMFRGLHFLPGSRES